MVKNIMLILSIFFSISYIQSLSAQEELGARRWMILPMQNIGEIVIEKYNAYKNANIQEDGSLIITIKQNHISGKVSNEILKIENIIRVQKPDGSWVEDKQVMADYKGSPKPLDFLSPGLCDSLVRRNYYWEEIKKNNLPLFENLINSGRCRDVYWWTPGRYEVSIYQMIARTDEWGGEFRIGDDELGYPFWTAGTFKVGLNHQILKVYFQCPVGMGQNNNAIIKSRLLEGGMGGGISFDVDNFGGRISFSDLTKKTGSFLEDENGDSIHYYIPFAAQGYYTFTIPINYFELSGAVRIKAGAGYHQVLPVRVIPNDSYNRLELVNDYATGIKRQDKISPYVRFDYVLKNNSGETFVQFYNLSLLIGAAYNFTDWFGVEAKLATWSLFRANDKWEQPNFFIISPRIRL